MCFTKVFCLFLSFIAAEQIEEYASEIMTKNTFYVLFYVTQTK